MPEIKKHRCGDTREDGMIFWTRSGKYEYWVTPDEYKRKKELQRDYVKKWDEKNPGKRAASSKKYHNTHPQKSNYKRKTTDEPKIYECTPSNRETKLVRGEVFETGCIRHHVYGDIRKEDGYIFHAYVKKWKARRGKYIMEGQWVSPENFEKMLARARDNHVVVREKFPEKLKAQKKNYYEKNKAKIQVGIKDWLDRNHDKKLAIQKRWRDKNPDKTNHAAARRRSRKRDAVVPLTESESAIIETIYDCSKRVSDCIGILHEVDHIIPISNGGKHIHTNMQILPMRINRSKAAKLPHEFTHP